MKKNLLRKSAIAVFTLTTASFYFAQEQETTSKDIEEVVLVGVADIAKDRKTPVAVSTIKESAIVEKLGNQEFPEILNTTPSVYATKSGGGFGDSKINIRGFGNENIAVMVNGMPVNDMEGGKVYWSNWAGLSDVTSAMQVQRGLGASKLAISSVGGTINIVTRASDKKQGGTLSVGIANDGYHKSLFSYNTGKSAKGWSSSILMSRTAGAMYADGTDFEGYNYYFALGYQPNKKHDFQFMVTGAPQKHNQRYYTASIEDHIKYGGNGVDRPNRKYNSLLGYVKDSQYLQSLGYNVSEREYAWGVNFYHKPVAMFNWDWNINSKNKLATVIYASLGRGGGSASPITGKTDNPNYINGDGLLNIDKMIADNRANPTSPKIVRGFSTNEHDWYGFVTNFTHKFDSNLQMSVGLDGRYYKGYHYRGVTDLLGATSYTDMSNKNLPNGNTVSSHHEINIPWNVFSKIKADKVVWNNDGEVLWGGVFGQLEYSNDKLSAFVQGAVSNQGFQRIDHFLKPGDLAVKGDDNTAMQKKTGFKNLVGFNVKGGLNYNITENHNVFGNIGYYEKQPFFSAVYPNNKNYLNPNLTNEKIFGVELGYSFRSDRFKANVNLYRTSWKDRYLSIRGDFDDYDYTTVPNAEGEYAKLGSKTRGFANVFGITEIHRGIEFDAEFKVADILSVTGMFSIGDWYFKGNASATYLTENSQPIYNAKNEQVNDVTLYLDKVKVGDAAQLTSSAGLKFNPITGLSFSADWRYVDQLYAKVDAKKFDSEKNKGALRLPSYNLFDLGISYKLNIGDKQSLTFRGNVYNLLDTTYITESTTNNHLKTVEDFKDTATKTAQQQYDEYLRKGIYKGLDKSNKVFFGYGRTWSASVTFNF